MSAMHTWEDTSVGPCCIDCGGYFTTALIHYNYNGTLAAREECPAKKVVEKPRQITADELQQVQAGKQIEAVLYDDE